MMILELTGQGQYKHCYWRAAKQNFRARCRAQRADLHWRDWQNALQFFGERCAFCGVSADMLNAPLTADHYVPLSWPHAPGSTACNLIPVCRGCNAIKGDLHPAIWLYARFGSAGGGLRASRIRWYQNSLG